MYICRVNTRDPPSGNVPMMMLVVKHTKQVELQYMQ